MNENSQEDQINELITILPGKDGWLSEDGEGEFQFAGKMLIEWGLTVEEASSILERCYHAAADDSCARLAAGSNH